jgi:DNA-binding LacI/PurR family transcriptional regulator
VQMHRLCLQHPRAIVCSAQAINEGVFTELAAYQSKGGIVVSYDVPISLACDQVIFDREDNAYLAARYLIQQGHRDLGLALSTPRQENGELYFNQNARLRGFKRALEEADLKLRREWIFEESTYEKGGAGLAMNFLALSKRPTGLCIVNDYMALGFMSAALRAGVRIPEDVSVIGHDNQDVAAFCPTPLTSATHPTSEIATAVVALLMDRLNGCTEPPRSLTIHSMVVERESVAACQTPPLH